MKNGIPQHLPALRERPCTCGQLIENCAGRVSVGASVRLPPVKLFRGHVRQSSRETGCLKGDGRGLGDSSCIRRCKKLGQTKIKDLKNVFRRDAQIGGLEVAVKDTLRVGRRQSACKLQSERDDIPFRQGPFMQAVIKRCSRNLLNHQIFQSVFRMEVVNRLDIGVVESAKKQSFAAKPLTG